MLDGGGPQLVAHRVGVPDRRVEQALDALRPVFPDGLGDLPAILPVHPREQPRQGASQPRPDLDPPKMLRDATIQPLPERHPFVQDDRFAGIGLPPLRTHRPALLFPYKDTGVAEVSL